MATILSSGVSNLPSAPASTSWKLALLLALVVSSVSLKFRLIDVNTASVAAPSAGRFAPDRMVGGMTSEDAPWNSIAPIS